MENRAELLLAMHQLTFSLDTMYLDQEQIFEEFAALEVMTHLISARRKELLDALKALIPPHEPYYEEPPDLTLEPEEEINNSPSFGTDATR